MKVSLKSSRGSTRQSGGWLGLKERLMVAVTLTTLAVWAAPGFPQIEFARKVSAQSDFTPQGITYVVTGTGDGDQSPNPRAGCSDLLTGKCTLRAAIQLANANPGADDITFNIPTSDPGFSSGTWTINLSRALDDISDLNITGPGAEKLIVKRNSSSNFRIFNVITAGTVSLSGLTITNGIPLPSNDLARYGGAIYNNSGILNVANCTLNNNSADNGGAVYNNGGTLNVTGSTFNNNSGNYGAAINNNAGTVNLTHSTLNDNAAIQGGGGIFSAGGSFNVTSSDLHNNSALVGAGIFSATNSHVIVSNGILSANTATTSGGAIYVTGATVDLANSTLSGNTITLAHGFGGGGGIYVDTGLVNVSNSTLSANSTDMSGSGGAIYNNAGLLNVFNCTLSGNSSGQLGGGIYNRFQAKVWYSTLAGNSASLGGAIYNDPSFGFDIMSCLVALNSATYAGPDVNGSFESRGLNLIGKTDGSGGFIAPRDQTGTIAAPLDPKLDPNGLQNNGGPTQTIALRFGSPAIDKGTSAGPNGNLTTDQRGAGFARTIDDPLVPNASGADGTDIGAFEVQTAAPTPTPTPTPTPMPNLVQFSASSYTVVEDCTTVTITVNRIGDTSGAASVSYATSDVTATERRDYTTALGRLPFAPGETSKTFAVLINEDSYVEGPETFNVTLTNPSGAGLGAPSIATVQITDDSSEPVSNVIDDPQSFAGQHYHDFLNRQADASGLGFWTNEITSCGSNQSCIDLKRINVSAAFYLSIEFQDTGYLVERIYKAAYGDANGTSTLGGAHQLAVPIVRLKEFLSDTQEIGLGVVVGQGNWQQQLESNKQAFTLEFAQRNRFTTALPASMTPAQFADTLFANVGVTPSQIERNATIGEFGAASNTADSAARGRALRRVAENPTLAANETNRAFVLMQYFGYLRRNPNDPQDSNYTGYDFWLTKLNQFNGNFVNAEMVRAFITSSEYRQRFGP